MAIKFKKQVAPTPTGNLVTPATAISKAELAKAEKEYRKSDHYKHKLKQSKTKK